MPDVEGAMTPETFMRIFPHKASGHFPLKGSGSLDWECRIAYPMSFVRSQGERLC